MYVKKIKTIVIAILLISISIGFLYFSRSYFFEREERMLCKEFLVNSEKVVELTGPIKQIEPSLKGSFVEGYGDEVSGRYSFIISGTSREIIFFIDWQTIRGAFTVTAIYVVGDNTSKEKLKVQID